MTTTRAIREAVEQTVRRLRRGSGMVGRLAVLPLAAGGIVVTVPVAGADAGVPGGAGELGVLTAHSDLEHLDEDQDDGDGDGDSGDSDDSDDSDSGGSGSDRTDASPARRSPPPQPAAPPPPAPVPAARPAPEPGAETRRGPPIAARHLVRPHLLRPVRGRVVGSLRPTLRWRHDARGVRLYNVQVFLGGRKVLSAFPASRYYRMPARRLGRGRQYVWRVWPYMAGRGYTARPLGVSWFATPRRAPTAR